MEEPYATFDTFTVGENFAPGEDPLAPPPKAPILARLPRLGTGNTNTKKNNRFDESEKGLIGVHAPAEEPFVRADGNDNPAATIRFDTVLTDDGYVENKQIEASIPMAARDQAHSLLEESAVLEEPAPRLQPNTEFDSWLLNLEAAIMPYSRWIVLAAVISALGLTMVLLRGSAPAAIGDAPLPDDRASISVSNSALAVVDESDSLPVVSTLSTGKGLQPIESSAQIITNTFATTARGPTAHETNSAPQARLAQQVRPIEPYRVTTPTERVEVARQSPVTGYPRTATNGPLAPATSERSTLR